MKISPFATSLLLSCFIPSVSARRPFSVDDVNCNSIPIAVDGDDIVLDGPINLKRCSRSDVSVFDVTNDSIIDCAGHSINGLGFSAIGQGFKKAFSVIGGATIINCHMSRHDRAITQVPDGSIGSVLTIQNSTFTNVGEAIFIFDGPSFGVGGKPNVLNMLVENSHFRRVRQSGISTYMRNRDSTTIQVRGVTMDGTGGGSQGISISGRNRHESLRGNGVCS